jgi:hypothetical protein
MPFEPWLSALLGATLLVNVALGYVLWRRGAEAGVDHGERSDGDAVVCQACGTENDTDYRFCRSCVAELRESSPLGTSGAERSRRSAL